MYENVAKTTYMLYNVFIGQAVWWIHFFIITKITLIEKEYFYERT